MNAIIALHHRAFGWAERYAGIILPTAARLIFAGVLARYFWASAQTKLGTGLLSPSDGAYIQIFPRAVEGFGYDFSQLTAFHQIVVLGGTWAEFLLPLLLILGLFTRMAAVGMVGFIIVQSLTDIIGHKADANTVGSWFDSVPDALILDQRAFWIMLLAVLILKGAGPFSIDRLLLRTPQV